MEQPANSLESEKQKYIYKDYFASGKVVFECQASNISEADQKYQEAIGKDVSKQNHIGCQIEKLPK